MREFAEAELVIPDGQYRGRRFRVDRQPFTGLLLDAMDDQRWREIFIAGPSQSGKTYIAFGLPLIYHTAELREPFVVGLPDMRMAQNKWRIDIEPIFRASPRLASLLPTKGPGSRGGEIKDTVTLTNGATLKFMTAGGEDTSKAGYTARVLGITEAARFSTSADASVEADPLRQLRARLRSYQRSRRRVYAEGTLTIADELPWTAREFSSKSRILCQCPHCKAWAAPSREHLGGWEGAADELEAAASSSWFCPDCGEAISERERVAGNQRAQLVHDGQHIDKRGRVCGQPPPTTRLWFHWTAYNNLFSSAADIGVEEWTAAKLEEESRERDNAERELAQFIHSEVWRPPALELAPLAVGSVAARAVDLPKGQPPDGTQGVAIGVDLGMYRGHWVAPCWRPGGLTHVLDYETFEVLHRSGSASAGDRRKSVERKLLESLNQFAANIRSLWRLDGKLLEPAYVFVDAGYLPSVVHAFCRAAGPAFIPALGRGTGQRAGYQYVHPKRRSREIRLVGEGYHLRLHRAERQVYAIVDSDHWKGRVQEGFKTDPGERGSITLWRDNQTSHKVFEAHLRAERRVQKQHPRHGLITTWEATSRANHYLDAAYLGAAASHLAGFRFVEDPAPEPAPKPQEPAAPDLRTPDGRDFYDTAKPH